MKDNRIINNFNPEIASLLAALRNAGFTVLGGHNGENTVKYPGYYVSEDAFIDDLAACDEANLYVCRDGFTFRLFLVLGNNPGELVSDWGWSKEAEGTQVLKDLDATISKNGDEWEGRAQPTTTADAKYRSPTYAKLRSEVRQETSSRRSNFQIVT